MAQWQLHVCTPQSASQRPGAPYTEVQSTHLLTANIITPSGVLTLKEKPSCFAALTRAPSSVTYKGHQTQNDEQTNEHNRQRKAMNVQQQDRSPARAGIIGLQARSLFCDYENYSHFSKALARLIKRHGTRLYTSYRRPCLKGAPLATASVSV